MNCPNCGGEVSERILVCGLCGTELAPFGGEAEYESRDAPFDSDDFDGFGARADVSPDFGRAPPPRRPAPFEDAPWHGRAREYTYEDAVESVVADSRQLDASEATPEKLEAARRALIGEEVEDYLLRFDSGSVFNVCGFFFGPFWYSYRRMVGMAVAYTLLGSLCGLVSLYMGCTGDKHYAKYIDERARELAKLDEESHAWQQYVAAHGGTSLGSVFLYFACALAGSFVLGGLIALIKG